MAQIFKYLLNEGSYNRVVLPEGYVPLHAGFQGGELYVWCMIDVANPDTIGIFHVVGTGWEFDPRNKFFMNTVLEDQYVWHIWWEHNLGS